MNGGCLAGKDEGADQGVPLMSLGRWQVGSMIPGKELAPAHRLPAGRTGAAGLVGHSKGERTC